MGLDPVDHVAIGHHATRVAAVTGCTGHPVGGLAGELAPILSSHHGMDAVHEGVGLTFAQADDAEPHLLEPATDGEAILLVATESVEVVDPHLVEDAGLGIIQESGTLRALGERQHPADPVVGVTSDDLDVALRRQSTIEGIGLGLDGLVLTLRVAADPLVGGHAARHGHRARSSLVACGHRRHGCLSR